MEDICATTQKAITKKFFAAYDGHDDERMLASLRKTAHKGDTFPMARTVSCRSEAASNKFGAAFHRSYRISGSK